MLKIIDIYCKQARKAEHASIEPEDDEDYFDETGHWEMQRSPDPWETSPTEQLERIELLAHMFRYIGWLRKMKRAAIKLRKLENCGSLAICKQLMVSATNLSVIVYRARMHLHMAWHRLLCVYCCRLAEQWKAIRAILRREPAAVTMPNTIREKTRRIIGAGQ